MVASYSTYRIVDRGTFCGYSLDLLVILKCLLAVMCMFFVAGSAGGSSAGVAQYCSNLETAWADINTSRYPG